MYKGRQLKKYIFDRKRFTVENHIKTVNVQESVNKKVIVSIFYETNDSVPVLHVCAGGEW